MVCKFSVRLVGSFPACLSSEPKDIKSGVSVDLVAEYVKDEIVSSEELAEKLRDSGLDVSKVSLEEAEKQYKRMKMAEQERVRLLEEAYRPCSEEGKHCKRRTQKGS